MTTGTRQQTHRTTLTLAPGAVAPVHSPALQLGDTDGKVLRLGQNRAEHCQVDT